MDNPGPLNPKGNAGVMFGQLSPQEIEDLLDTETVARLGCHADGRTYVVPITYVYDGRNLIGHSAEGRKIWMMRANKNVCVEIDRMYNHANWRSVVAWGEYEELGGDEALKAKEMLIARFKPKLTSASASPERATYADHGALEGGPRNKAVIYRIKLTEKTGRFERR